MPPCAAGVATTGRETGRTTPTTRTRHLHLRRDLNRHRQRPDAGSDANAGRRARNPPAPARETHQRSIARRRCGGVLRRTLPSHAPPQRGGADALNCQRRNSGPTPPPDERRPMRSPRLRPSDARTDANAKKRAKGHPTMAPAGRPQ
ncbi:hypothetical protein DIPPA_31415 [Diplonema papillatum]|nr:hypothetical protein DIPPA_31415 [Diplonema papillatum]